MLYGRPKPPKFNCCKLTNQLCHKINQLIKSFNEPIHTFCELWDLRHASVENICKSWLSALKSAWGLPSMCRSSVLDIVTDVLLPLYDLICLRALLFTKRRLNSDSDVVRYVASYGLQYGRMSSIHGSNIQFCCERFLQNQNELLGKSFDKRHVYVACLNRRDTESYCRAAYVCLNC